MDAITRPCKHVWDGPRIPLGNYGSSMASCSKCGVPVEPGLANVRDIVYFVGTDATQVRDAAHFHEELAALKHASAILSECASEGSHCCDNLAVYKVTIEEIVRNIPPSRSLRSRQDAGKD